MPAIQPARLKKQTAELAEYFHEPDSFVRKLYQLFEYYSERTQRSGQSGEPSPLIDAFKVRPPVLRQVIQEITPYIKSFPRETLELCDALWIQPLLEFRILAAKLLGKLPPAHASQVAERVVSWSSSENEEILTNLLLSESLPIVMDENPEAVLGIIEEWLGKEEIKIQQLGLQAISSIISKKNINYLPVLFRFIQPYILDTPPDLQHFTIQVVKAIARLSPQETAYFLQNSFEHPGNVNSGWIIRRSVEVFPPDIRSELREIARMKS